LAKLPAARPRISTGCGKEGGESGNARYADEEMVY